MDSLRFDRAGRWWLLAGLTLPALAWLAALPGCAEPCLDDGLGQKFCPELDTEAMSGSGTTDPTTGPTTGGETEGCPALDVILIPQTPTVVLLVDQSGSMNEDLGMTGVTRWDTITDVLINTVVPQFGGDIRLGLTLYTSTDEDAMAGDCPLLDVVDPALDNVAPITTQLMNANPVEDTPTGESLTAVTAALEAFAEPGRKYIVLATDGLPDTCEVPDPVNDQEQDAANAVSVTAVEAAYAANIETFVIDVGDTAVDHLQELANAGQGVQPGDPDATFYDAEAQVELVSAFEEILASVRSCELSLMSPLSMEDAGSCVLEVNGEVVALDDPNGWQLNGSDEVELLGTACDTLQAGVASVQMECSCG